MTAEERARYQRELVNKRRGEPLPDKVEHGTPNAYNNYGCRCEVCKSAYRLYQIEQVAGRRAKGLPTVDSRHGTYNGYLNYHCRCERCVEANRVYSIGYRLKTGMITELKARELIAKGGA